jgi:hypothetical protein
MQLWGISNSNSPGSAGKGVSLKSFLWPLLLVCVALGTARAQENYEIQVYGSETQAPHSTMVELHSNFTADGQRRFLNGVDPTYRAEHETIEDHAGHQ